MDTRLQSPSWNVGGSTIVASSPPPRPTLPVHHSNSNQLNHPNRPPHCHPTKTRNCHHPQRTSHRHGPVNANNNFTHPHIDSRGWIFCGRCAWMGLFESIEDVVRVLAAGGWCIAFGGCCVCWYSRSCHSELYALLSFNDDRVRSISCICILVSSIDDFILHKQTHRYICMYGFIVSGVNASESYGKAHEHTRHQRSQCSQEETIYRHGHGEQCFKVKCIRVPQSTRLPRIETRKRSPCNTDALLTYFGCCGTVYDDVDDGLVFWVGCFDDDCDRFDGAVGGVGFWVYHGHTCCLFST